MAGVPPPAPCAAQSEMPLTSVAHPRTLRGGGAVVLLGGSVRSTPLSEAFGRSVLDLPLDADGSIFNHWLMHPRSGAARGP